MAAKNFYSFSALNLALSFSVSLSLVRSLLSRVLLWATGLVGFLCLYPCLFAYVCVCV